MRLFWALPLIVILAGVVLTRIPIPQALVLPAAPETMDVRQVLWTLRHLDILGQILILLGGAFGVIILAKEIKRD
jgi:hypothetical protein